MYLLLLKYMHIQLTYLYAAYAHLKLIPHHSLQHKVQIMAETEPLNEDGSPHIARLKKEVQLEMKDKMVW